MPTPEEIVRKLLDKIAKEQKYNDHEVKVESISSGGASYSSALFNITLSAPQKEDLQLFAKVATMSEKVRQDVGTEGFSTEIVVYEKLASAYNAIQEKNKKNEIDLFKFPKFYGANPNVYEETVVLENLVAHGFETFNRFISVDWPQASNAFEILAKFHALSFAFQKEQPEQFEECSGLMIDMDLVNMKETFQKSIERCIDVLNVEYRERVLKCLQICGDNPYSKYNRPLGKRVLVHGDYRPSNMLYKREGDKVESILIDYQTVHIGCPVSDIMYYVFVATDKQFRAEHYERLIEHYYEHLTLSLNRLGLDPTEAYSRAEFDSDLKEMLPFGLYLSMTVLPVVMVEEENAPTIEGENAVFEDMAVPVASNALYAERLDGIVSDFARWGVL